MARHKFLERGLQAGGALSALDMAQEATDEAYGGTKRGRKGVAQARAKYDELYERGIANQGVERAAGMQRDLPAAQQDLIAGIGGSGYDKSTGALGGADQYLAAATSKEDLVNRQGQLAATAGDRRFNPQAQQLYEQGLVKVQQAQQEAQFQQLERAGGRYGSNLSVTEFLPMRDKAMQFQNGIDNTRFLMDVIDQTTPAQLAVMPKVRGRVDAAVYSMYRTVQTMSESKDSVLRESERVAIKDFLGDPGGFIKGLTTRDARTIEKLKFINEAQQRNQKLLSVGMDEKTIGLLNQAAQPNPEMYKFQVPEGATIRDAEGFTLRSPFEGVGGEIAAGVENVSGLLENILPRR